MVSTFQILGVLLLVHQSANFIGVANVYLEQPSLLVAWRIYQAWGIFNGVVLLGYCARNRWKQFASSFDALEGTTLRLLCQFGTNLWKLCKNYVSEGFLYSKTIALFIRHWSLDNYREVLFTNLCIVGDSYGTNLTVHNNPFMFAGVAPFCKINWLKYTY